MINISTGSTLLIALALGTGCGVPGAAPLQGGAAGAIVASGSVSAGGTSVPGDARALVVWRPDSSSGASLYKFGEGSAANGSFRVELNQAPPAAALRQEGWGAGFIALVDTNVSVPDGPMDDDVLERSAVGTSRGYAIIYRGPGATGPSWLQAFPEGYSCGAGQQEDRNGEDDHDGGAVDGEHQGGGSDDGVDHDGGIEDGEHHDGGVEDGEHHDGGIEDGEHHDGGVEDGEHHDGGVEDGEHHDGGIDGTAPSSSAGSSAAMLIDSTRSVPRFTDAASSSIDHEHEFDSYTPVSCAEIPIDTSALPNASPPAQ